MAVEPAGSPSTITGESSLENPAELVDRIHHINFPCTDPMATAEWYGKVFGCKPIDVSKLTPNTKTLLLTVGHFDLHFHPVDEMPGTRHHFAIEVKDWDKFIAHIEELGLWYEEPYERPHNNSKTSELRDPDGHHVELVWHGDWH
jgi:catechol 2,3-dioxygenase-like lactoylglutathione lyase family enzyme